MSDRQPDLPNRQTPFSEAFKAFIADGWAPYPADLPQPAPAVESAIERRAAISRQFPGERLVIPAGGLKVRSNDTDFRYRPHSAFAHLSGLGADREPDAVLVMEPTDSGHDACLYFTPRAPRDTEEFYANARFGEMWVGRRMSLDELSAHAGIGVADLSDLADQLRKNADDIKIRLVMGAGEEIAALVAEIRGTEIELLNEQDIEVLNEQDTEAVSEQDTEAVSDQDIEAVSDQDSEFSVALSELRLVKDAYEINEMRASCANTADAFEAVVAELPEAVRRGRGERWVEGIFALHARHVGNTTGYDTIAASGNHACTLHWIRNDGDLREGDLLLLDAGVERDSLYTADVTRTLPINGRFTDAQRKVYDAVLEAQEAGIAAAQPGATFAEIHQAAIAVIAAYLDQWGLLPVSAEESLAAEGGQHRRWMVHGTSHHLGIDVHDCAQARNENYRQGTLAPGMIVTVEPGLYFTADDLLVPEELRGIGVRIEDDILITASGNENLSAALPRLSSEVESWMAEIWAGND